MSEHLHFGLRSNYAKSNQFRGCFCTKHAPFRYRFDEKPPLIVSATASRFLPARIPQAGRCRENPAKMPPRISSPRNPVREDGYPTPTNARKGRFRPKKRHSTRNLPKHFRAGMIWRQKHHESSDVTEKRRELGTLAIDRLDRFLWPDNPAVEQACHFVRVS